MHAINAIAEKPVFNIEAALSSPEVRSLSHLLASAGIEKPTAKFNLADLDRKLAASRLSIAQRLQIKVVLNRAHLIAD